MLKIVVDGTVLEMALKANTSRTGIYFVIKNICEYLNKKEDVDLKITVLPKNKLSVLNFFNKKEFLDCFDLSKVKFGKEKLIFLMPFHPPSPDLFKIQNVTFFQILYDFSFHICPELKNLNGYKYLEENLIKSLNSKSYALCISEQTKKDLLLLSNFPSNRIGVFDLAIKNEILIENNTSKTNKNLIKKKLNIPLNSKYLLCLSTLEPRKNLKASIEIFKLVIEKLNLDDLYLVLAGAPGWEDINSIIGNLKPKIKNRIILTGYMNDENLYQLYSHSLCLLYPSFYEGFGLPPLEAMYSGTPVILSNRGALYDLFNHISKTYDPYDYNSMADMVCFWYLNPDKRLDEITKLKKFAENFTWKKSIDQIYNFIKNTQINKI